MMRLLILFCKCLTEPNQQHFFYMMLAYIRLFNTRLIFVFITTEHHEPIGKRSRTERTVCIEKRWTALGKTAQNIIRDILHGNIRVHNRSFGWSNKVQQRGK